MPEFQSHKNASILNKQTKRRRAGHELKFLMIFNVSMTQKQNIFLQNGECFFNFQAINLHPHGGIFHLLFPIDFRMDSRRQPVDAFLQPLPGLLPRCSVLRSDSSGCSVAESSPGPFSMPKMVPNMVYITPMTDPYVCMPYIWFAI